MTASAERLAPGIPQALARVYSPQTVPLDLGEPAPPPVRRAEIERVSSGHSTVANVTQ